MIRFFFLVTSVARVHSPLWKQVMFHVGDARVIVGVSHVTTAVGHKGAIVCRFKTELRVADLP